MPPNNNTLYASAVVQLDAKGKSEEVNTQYT